MKLKIIKAEITSVKGKKILKPNDKVIESIDLEKYRTSLKDCEYDTVLFTYEET